MFPSQRTAQSRKWLSSSSGFLAITLKRTVANRVPLQHYFVERVFSEFTASPVLTPPVAGSRFLVFGEKAFDDVTDTQLHLRQKSRRHLIAAFMPRDCHVSCDVVVIRRVGPVHRREVTNGGVQVSRLKQLEQQPTELNRKQRKEGKLGFVLD